MNIYNLKYIVCVLSILLISACDNNKKTKKDNLVTVKPKIDSKTSSVLTVEYQTNFRDHNISNNTDRQIDLLFNGIHNYFGSYNKKQIDFNSECLECEPIQEYYNGLVFAKQLLIKTNQIKFFDFEITGKDGLNHINVQTNKRERKNTKFKFSDGVASIKYIALSCDDADYNKVQLTYPSGEILIDSLINASFFEYDLNKNGQNEQYLYGTRNCSQEFVLLRIRKDKDK